jgi:hypothetical protein
LRPRAWWFATGWTQRGMVGVNGGAAVLATLAYRLFNYWLYLPAGLVGLNGSRTT